MTYKEAYLDPRWQKKRLLILQRDNFTCQDCGATTKTLHIHHKYYTGGAMPWEYPDKALMTLCDGCHLAEQNSWSEDIPLFINAFKKSEFFVADLLTLAEGIQKTQLLHIHDVVASAYSFAFKDPEMQKLIIEKYFESIKSDVPFV